MRRGLSGIGDRLAFGGETAGQVQRFWAQVRAGQPDFTRAVLADARVAMARRGDTGPFSTRVQKAAQIVRLSLVTDAFLALLLYRAKAAAQRRGIPLLPLVLHRMAVVAGQVTIGDPVFMEPGVYIPHGYVVVDGLTSIGTGVTLSPFTTIGVVAGGARGPVVGALATIGTGAKVLGPVRVGARATVGANAVVVDDVPVATTVVGVPARVISQKASGT